MQQYHLCARRSAVHDGDDHAAARHHDAAAAVPAWQRELQVQVGRHVQRSCAQVRQYVLPAVVHVGRRGLSVRVAQRHAGLHVADAEMHDDDDEYMRKDRFFKQRGHKRQRRATCAGGDCGDCNVGVGICMKIENREHIKVYSKKSDKN